MTIQQEIYQTICTIKKYYKLTGIDLSRQANMSIPQRIHFIGKVEEDTSVTMFLSMKISKELFSSFFRFIKHNRIMQTMESRKILNLLNEATHSKSVTRKWNMVNDQSNANQAVGNEIIYSKEVLKSNLCNLNNAYVLGRGDITILGCNAATQVVFKNGAPFTKCIKN